MPRPLLIFSQSGYLIQIVVINLHTWWQTVQIQISWLLQKPTDLDLHCLQNRIYPDSAGQRACSDNSARFPNWNRGTGGGGRIFQNSNIQKVMTHFFYLFFFFHLYVFFITNKLLDVLLQILSHFMSLFTPIPTTSFLDRYTMDSISTYLLNHFPLLY